MRRTQLTINSFTAACSLFSFEPPQWPSPRSPWTKFSMPLSARSLRHAQGLSSAPASDSRSADRSVVRTGNAGSALGFGQGLWVWLTLAGVGVVLIPLYARLLGRHGWLAISAVGLQLGGALGNLLDRLTLGGATDIIHAGWGPVWNIADVALAVGAVLATWALVRRRRVAIDDKHDVSTCYGRDPSVRHGEGQRAAELLK